MALNPFFLQGSPSEQRLVQELINEQLKIYGIEVTYIPRKFVRKETILREVSSSKFDDNFLLEAYVNTYEGYGGSGDILSKFGMSLRDELELVISRERFEDFISPFLEEMDQNEIELVTRPREGDLIYFPLGQRLFEVKFVEHESPFYQLGKNYVYTLKCELFEYEDEVIDTSIDEIDTQIQDQGYITTLNLIGVGRTATVSAQIGSGYVNNITIINDGSGYTTAPIISFSEPPQYGIRAEGIAVITNKAGVYSLKQIQLTRAGAGYTVAPTINIQSSSGTGASAVCSISTTTNGVIVVNVLDGGVGYSTSPNITFSSPGIGTTATAITVVENNNEISAVRIINPGSGYISAPSISINSPPIITGIGTYIFNEIVIGSRSNTTGRVKNWDYDSKQLKVSIVDGEFYDGEIITGTISSARYSTKTYDKRNLYDKYSQNVEIEEAADDILDFSESNPFGNY
jgi:hypothetical protein